MSLIPYDDRDGVIWFDGEMVPWREAKLHVLSHALHYASCVFEGERVYGGRIFRLGEHSQRLRASAALMDFEIPYSVAEIDAASAAVVAANGVVDGYLRPVAWRGAEQMGVSAQNCRIHLAIATWQWPAYFGDEGLTRGIALDFARYRRPSPDCAPTASKAAGLYMICTLSRHAAEAAGYQDALMLDWRGRVAEATGANIFLVKDGTLHTPTPDCFLDGITRRSVMALAKARGIETIERTILPDELGDFDEVFLTGTAAEITPIRQIGPDIHYQVGPITHRLAEDYAALVRA